MSEEFDKNTQENTISPAQYTYDADAEANAADDPVIRRRKIKSGYNWAGGSVLIQTVIVFIVSVVVQIAFMPAFMKKYFEGVDMASLTQEKIMEATLAMATDGRYLILINSISYLIGNVAAFFIGVCALKAFKAKDIFGRSRLGAGQIALGALGILGVQGLSYFIQVLISSFTGISGMSESTVNTMAFNDDMVKTAVTLFYFIIIAPVTEELLFRGVVLNALSPVDRIFGLVATSLLFGLMHGNFNQMFNGFLLGLLLGYIALKSGSVVPSIIVHMIANANAMFCSYFYEYKLAASQGMETAGMAEMIHFGVLLVLGIVGAVILLKKNGKITSEDTIVPSYSFELEPEECAKLKWKQLVKSPTFWIVTAVYVIMAISMVSQTGA